MSIRIPRSLTALAILIVGAASCFHFSKAPAKEQDTRSNKRSIRTKVVRLHSTDYSISIQASGTIQAHNEITLGAQVAGQIVKVSPSLEVGSFVRKGEVLVEIESSDHATALKIAESQLRVSESARKLSRSAHARNAKLRERKGISETVYEQSLETMARTEAEYDVAASQVEQAKRNLARTKIVSPFDGRVRVKTVGVGQLVEPGSPLAMLFDVGFVEVRLAIADRECQHLRLPELATDSPIPIEFTDGVNSESGNTWNGRIVRTEASLDENSLELFAVARIDDPFGTKSGKQPLRVGQPVVAKIPGETLHNVMVVPRHAVRELDHVYFVDNREHSLLGKKLFPIWSDRASLIVRDPTIQDGQLLATTKLAFAPDGAKVEIIDDVMNYEQTTSHDASPTTSHHVNISKTSDQQL